MTDTHQCPFCQRHYDTIEQLTLHLVFETCTMQLATESPEAFRPTIDPVSMLYLQLGLVPESQR